jgi:hypothetical protein
MIIELQEIIDVFVATEEIRRLALFFARTAALRAKMFLAHLRLGPIGFFVDAIPAFVGRKVDVVVLARTRRRSSARSRSGGAGWSG